MVADIDNGLQRSLKYIDGVLYHGLESFPDVQAECAYAQFKYGDCGGPIHQGEGYVAVMPLGVVHMRHVDLIQTEPGA